MGRAAYCRQQAALCREIAAQLSLRSDAEHVRETARVYDAEADGIDAAETAHRAGGKPSSES